MYYVILIVAVLAFICLERKDYVAKALCIKEEELNTEMVEDAISLIAGILLLMSFLANPMATSGIYLLSKIAKDHSPLKKKE